MNQEAYEQHKAFAGERKPSMMRRRVGHDYTSRRMYLVTITTEGRRPLLGTLVSDGQEPTVLPTPLGQRVTEEWHAVSAHHPEAKSVAFQLMPDHLHGILFVESPMQQHLGQIIAGFKASTNKAYRQLILGQPPSAPTGNGTAATGTGAATKDNGAAATGNGAATKGNGAAATGNGAAAAGPEAAATPQQSQLPAGAGGGLVGCAAALPQLNAQPSAIPQPSGIPQPWRKPSRDRSHENREHGLLWTPGYNDHILSGEGELQRWIAYLKDNPRRLSVKRQNPALFRVHFDVRISSFNCSAQGNMFLLHHPQRKQVQCSTHLYQPEIEEQVAGFMAAARQGAVLVSPAISSGEKQTMRAALNARLPVIYISSKGLTPYTKPGGEYFEACAAGRMLIVSPFGHTNRNTVLTRPMCMTMNRLAFEIANQE